MDQDAILALLRRDPKRVFTLPELLKKAGIAPEHAKAARRMLKALVRSGAIEREQGRRYRLSRAGQEVRGRIGFDRHKAPWLYVDGPKTRPVPISHDDRDRVEAHDLVLAKLASSGKRGKLEARVVEVLERPKLRQLGLFRRVAKTTFVELEPNKLQRGKKPRTPIEIVVPPDATLSAEDGQLVEVEVLKKGRAEPATMARVVRILGKMGERETEMQRLLLEHALETSFPDDVEAEARAHPKAPTQQDISGRRDIRNVPLVTIDSETAKDFDDAVGAIRRGHDGFVLYVAIADVAHYVQEKTALDREAMRRGTSTYLTDRAIPMLPESLSNELCSLKPNVDRLCQVVELAIDRTGHIESADFYAAVMRSKARLTYTRVADALEGEPDEECRELLPTLLLLSKIAQLLLARRLKRGAIDLDVPEPVVIFDEDHVPVDVQKRPRNDAHRLIEDLMLAANEAVAGCFVDLGLPSIFRIHEDPDPDKLETFTALCRELGVPLKLKKHPQPSDVAALLEKLTQFDVGRLLHGILLRSLTQARYDAESKGHFGLAAERYLHFTSPIRRYPDLIVHRLLKRLLEGKELGYTKQGLQEIAERASEAERRAMLAERESMDVDRSFVALEHLGERMPATITGAQSFGLFAQIATPFIEGMIPVSSLPEDYYVLDDYGVMLRGSKSGRMFMLGQPLEVEIASVNISRRQVELRITGAQEQPRKKSEPRKKKRR
jgi:ribonuclease R